LDIYFCPFFETPTTFGQKFLSFFAFGKILKNEHFLIKNRKVLKTDKISERTPAFSAPAKVFSL
jgi:hypothetical protein